MLLLTHKVFINIRKNASIYIYIYVYIYIHFFFFSFFFLQGTPGLRGFPGQTGARGLAVSRYASPCFHLHIVFTTGYSL